MLPTKTLQGNALNWLISQITGDFNLNPQRDDNDLRFLEHYADVLRYAEDWTTGGPVMEGHVSRVFRNVGGSWTAQIKTHINDGTMSGYYEHTNASGPTPLLAVMRCVALREYGPAVHIPLSLQN